MNYLFLLFGFVLTVVIYYFSKFLHKKFTVFIFSPLLICPIIIVCILLSFHVNYANYNASAQYLSKLLGPATVAFAVPIYKHLPLILKNLRIIFISLFVGVIVAFSSSYILATVVALDKDLIYSLVPRSITTPIAMDISTLLGGEPTLTAIFVIITGLAGSVFGPYIIRLLAIRSSAAKGLMLGMGAHGAGTSAAFSIGELEGTYSSVAMILAALISIVLSEFFFHI